MDLFRRRNMLISHRRVRSIKLVISNRAREVNRSKDTTPATLNLSFGRAVNALHARSNHYNYVLIRHGLLSILKISIRRLNGLLVINHIRVRVNLIRVPGIAIRRGREFKVNRHASNKDAARARNHSNARIAKVRRSVRANSASLRHFIRQDRTRAFGFLNASNL